MHFAVQWLWAVRDESGRGELTRKLLFAKSYTKRHKKL